MPILKNQDIMSGRRPRRENGEDDSLSSIAREAEARLAAKRAARAEAREIRLKELEKQQREVLLVLTLTFTPLSFLLLSLSGQTLDPLSG